MTLNSQKKILICILVILVEVLALCKNAEAVVYDLTNMPDSVDAKFQGTSNSTAIFYNIQNNGDSPVSIAFKAGSSFLKNSGGFQDLVLSESGSINVPPHSRVSGILNALCVNKGIPVPSPGAGSLTPVTRIHTILPALQCLISDFICDVEKHEKETGLKLPPGCKQSVIHLIVFQNDHQRKLSYTFPYLDTSTLKALISELKTLMRQTTRSDLLDDEYQLGQIYQKETKKIAEKYFKTDVELKRFYSLWISSFRSVLYELIYAYRENKYHPFKDIIERTLDSAHSISGSRRYRTRTGDRVTLRDSVWEEILLKMPDARAYEGNIKETLENPDCTIKAKYAGSGGGGGGPPPPGGPGNYYDDDDDDDHDEDNDDDGKNDDDKKASITVDDPISRLAETFFKLYPDRTYNFGDDNEVSGTFVKYFKKFADLLGGKFFSVVVHAGQVVDIAITDRPVKNNPNYYSNLSRIAAGKPDRDEDLDPFADEEPIAVLKDTITSPSQDALKYIKNKAGELIALPQREENVFRKSMRDVFADVFQSVGCSVNTVLREYNDEFLDLSVKVPGGKIVVKRLLYANSWHWEHVRHNLRFISTERVKIESIEKGGVIYKLTNPSNSQGTREYIHGTYKIIETKTGYQWKDKFGNWKTYSPNGNMTSYGNQTGVIGKLIYDERTRLVAVADRNEKKVIGFDYNNLGQILRVYDNKNREVKYDYINGLLISVKDVLGNKTNFEYDHEGKIIKITNDLAEKTITYNEDGDVIQVLDREGNGYSFKYDYLNNKREYYVHITNSSGMIKEVWFHGKFVLAMKPSIRRGIMLVFKEKKSLLGHFLSQAKSKSRFCPRICQRIT